MRTLWQFRHWWALMNEPTKPPQPLYQPFRDPVPMTLGDRLEAKRQQAVRYLHERGLLRCVERKGPAT